MADQMEIVNAIDGEIFDRAKDLFPPGLTIDAERWLRLVKVQFERTPKLYGCEPRSIETAIIQLASLGLEPSGILGHASLIPRGGLATCEVEYKGYIEIAHRSGVVASFYARPVFEKDEYEVDDGTAARIVHKKYRGDDDPGPLCAAYAVVKFTNGGMQFEDMTRREILRIKMSNPAVRKGKTTPWTDPDHEPEMWRKSPIKKIRKFLPMNVIPSRLREVIDIAERNEFAEDMREPDYDVEGANGVGEGDFSAGDGADNRGHDDTGFDWKPRLRDAMKALHPSIATWEEMLERLDGLVVDCFDGQVALSECSAAQGKKLVQYVLQQVIDSKQGAVT